MSDAKHVLEQAIETWNAGDREAWAALYDESVEWEAPGGARISGLEDLKVKYFDALLEAAPDRASIVDSLFAEGDFVAEEGRYTGTHTGTWRNPGGVEYQRLARAWTFRSVRSSASRTERSSRSACTTTSSRCSRSLA
jgi:hypothetical protein